MSSRIFRKDNTEIDSENGFLTQEDSTDGGAGDNEG